MKHLISLLSTLCLLCACNSDLDNSLVTKPEPENSQYTRISNTNQNITPDEASAVAMQYLASETGSRSPQFSRVKNIVTITDDNSTPTLYAVNFDDGYILISASKSSNPIQAIVEHGTYENNDTFTARDFVVNDLISMIKSAKVDNPPQDRALWLPYEQSSKLTTPQSRAISPELTDARGQMEYDMESLGYEVFISNDEILQDIMPTDIYDRFMSLIESYSNEFEMELDQDAKYAGLVGIKSINRQIDSKPKCSTIWGQEAPYNSATPGNKPLGCVTVAVGQLMKYYKKPDTYNWDAMPNRIYSSAYPDLINFLDELRTRLNVDDGGGANINDALRVLKSYGYNATIDTYYIATTPCYARGTNIYKDDDADEYTGHAWIYDGEKTTYYSTEYVLYFPTEEHWPEFVYKKIDEYVTPESSYTMTYINWGWDGDFNGWYKTPTFKDGNGKIYSYTSNCKFINIKN